MSNKISDELEKANQEWGSGEGKSDFLKLKEGDNVIRVLTPLFAYPSHFKVGACIGKEDCPECKKTREDKDGNPVPNKPSIKFICNVLAYPTLKEKEDAKANNLPEPQPGIKIGQFSYGIAKALQDLQDDQDWAFSEFPMPYNIKIKAVKAGTKEVEYTVIASPNKVSVSPEVIEKLSKMTTPENLRENFKKAQMKRLGLAPKETKSTITEPIAYPEEQINPDDIPF